MEAIEIEKYRGLKECVAFHGHLCPGLAIGYRASLVGMDRLREQRSKDEELVAIVENDACFVDAVQVITGCTFGKGNLIFKDYGKMVVTFISRKSGKGVRISLRQQEFRSRERSEEHFRLIQKVINNEATEEEIKRFWELHNEKSKKVLETPEEELFVVRDVSIEIPPKARIEPSEVCGLCGEATMKSKMVEVSGRRFCKECAQRGEGVS